MGVEEKIWDNGRSECEGTSAGTRVRKKKLEEYESWSITDKGETTIAAVHEHYGLNTATDG